MNPELMAFLFHLRLHYQFLILSGAFLSGAVFSGVRIGPRLWIGFLSVHILLFGGVTVYSRIGTRIPGPSADCARPPPLAPWTLPASWLTQFLRIGPDLARFPTRGRGLRGVHALLLGLQPSRHPVEGTAIAQPGRHRREHGRVRLPAGISARGTRCGTPACSGRFLGVACLIVSLFPMSQVYQVGEDLLCSDMTFTARFGLRGQAIYALFPCGVAILAGALATRTRVGRGLRAAGRGFGLGVWRVRIVIADGTGEYGRVMAVKYIASGLFSAFLVAVLWIQGMGRLGAIPG